MEIPEKFPKIVIDEMPEYFQYRMIETKKALEQNLSKFSSLSVSAYFFVKSRPIEASSRPIDNTQQQLFGSRIQKFDWKKAKIHRLRTNLDPHNFRTRGNKHRNALVNQYIRFQSEEIELQREVSKVEISHKGQAIALDTCVRCTTVKNS